MERFRLFKKTARRSVREWFVLLCFAGVMGGFVGCSQDASMSPTADPLATIGAHCDKCAEARSATPATDSTRASATRFLGGTASQPPRKRATGAWAS